MLRVFLCLLLLAAGAPTMVHAQRGGPAGEWELLGEGSVGFRTDNDSIQIRQNEQWFRDRSYRALRFAAERNDVHMDSIRIHYINGHAEEIGIDRMIRRGEALDVDLPGERSYLKQIDMRYRANPAIFFSSLLGLALVAQAQEIAGEALAYAQTAHEFAAEIRRPALLERSATFAVRLALLNGQVADAEYRTQGIETAANQGTQLEIELPALTRIQALFAVGTPAALTEGLAFATTCLHHAEALHNTRQVIQICALRALILHALHRTAESFEVLARALALGEAGGFMRTFIDLGAPMADLLRRLGATRGQSPRVKRLLAAFHMVALL